jgi:uncharacterized protein (TIGR03437 family)
VGKKYFASGALVCGLLGAGALRAQTTVTVTATPAALTFNYQSGAATLPKSQTVSMRASSGSPSFTTATPGTDFWLAVSLDSGNLPATLSVSVNPNSLPVAQYTSSVTVTVTGVAAPLVIPVTLNVTAAPSTLSMNPATLTFTAPPNPSAPQTVTLSTNGAPISFTATAGATWLTVSPTVGIVLPGDLAMLNVTVNATALTPSATPYTANITVVASGASVTTKSQNIAVGVTVNSQTPSIVSIWPPSLPVNGPAQIITVRGANFFSGSVVGIQNGSNVTALTTTVISDSALEALVPASMLTTAGTLNVLVQNPAPGGNSVAVLEQVANVPIIYGVFNSASYASASVSPGELVTIFGSNIGPTTPATMSITNGYVDTLLSNVTLTIDGQNAPLLYVSPTQVTAQVPYEATLGPGKTVVLTNGTNPAANATVTIAASAPGIFTANGSGTGQAAAINTSATTGAVTLNSTTSPAKIGDMLTLFLTGEGNYNPSLIPGAVVTNTGFIIPTTLSPLPQISPTPTVQIGGVDATAGVAYAGVVPGSIIGVLQINVAVPTGSSTGAAVPLAISIGGNSTQSGVTLNVHP